MMRKATMLIGLALLGGNASAMEGKSIFEANCAACHQPDGAGSAGLAPPLLGTLGKRVGSPVGRQYLTGVLISGMAGRLVSKGVTYNGAMPNWQQFSDAELAGVANYVLSTFNGPELAADHQPLTAEEFAAMRANKPSGKQLRAWRSETD